MRTWLLSAVAAVALGLGATASDASAAPVKPVACAPMAARHVRVAHRGWVKQRGHYRVHRYAHYRHAPRRAYRHRR
jgi:hypothetical protein